MGLDYAGHTLWCREVNDVAVTLEHVDLLNARDGLDVHLLESRLQFLVVGTGGLVDLLDLSSGSTLATSSSISIYRSSYRVVRRRKPRRKVGWNIAATATASW